MTNSKKIATIINIEEPNSICNLQSLNGKIVTLSRFRSKLTEKSLYFFKTLRSHLAKVHTFFRKRTLNNKWSKEELKAFYKLSVSSMDQYNAKVFSFI